MGAKALMGGIAALMVAAGGYSVASPYLAIGEIRDAMRDGKADVLRQHIDFPALRESVKGQLNAAMMKSAATDRDENPFAAVGVMLAGALAGPMVDRMLTPESLTAMARGGRPSAGRDAKGGTATLDNFKGKYEAWNRFVVTVPEEDRKASVAFVFTRERFTDWKLTAMRLPDDWAQ